MAELKIIEQPKNTFRYRYKSEMNGAHGHIAGETSKNTVKTLPRVAVLNWPHTAIIRCTLAAATADDEHPHRLVKGQMPEPHDEKAEYDEVKKCCCVTFKLGIIQTAKRDSEQNLKEKYERRFCSNKCGTGLTAKETTEIDKKAKAGAKKLDMNTVRLRFEAYDENMEPIRDSSGNPLVILSQKIANSKCAANGDLLISMSSHASGNCRGGDSVMLFVNKVDKNNIKVRFFEEDEEGNCCWEAFAIIEEVHHQFGIAMTTPKYRDLNLTSDVVVYYELVRPKDKEKSRPLEFIYKAESVLTPGIKRKLDSDSVEEELQKTVPCTTPSLERYMEEVSSTNRITTTTEIGDSDYGAYTSELSQEAISGDGSVFLEPIPQVTEEETVIEIPSEPLYPMEYLEEMEEGFGYLLDIVSDSVTPRRSDKRPTLEKAPLQNNLWRAISAGNEGAFAECLIGTDDEKRRMLETWDSNGLSAVHLAAKHGQLQLLNCVMKLGVDLMAFDKCHGRTAFHWAVLKANKEVILLLVREAAYGVEYEDWNGQTPLHYATKSANAAICELLLDAEADPEAPDLWGVSPLHLAKGNAKLEKSFAQYGDDLELKLASMTIDEY